MQRRLDDQLARKALANALPGKLYCVPQAAMLGDELITQPVGKGRGEGEGGGAASKATN